MFTGLIEEVGEIVTARRTSSGLALRLRAPELSRACSASESVAVNGVCLTVEEVAGGELVFHVGAETLEKSTARDWSAGQAVNLERALAAGARFGGHFVQGHVDATGVVTGVRREGETVWLSLRFPETGGPYLVEKGSVAVDGISLTIARLAPSELTIAVIPYTWDHTALVALRPGTSVNLEYDLLGKYVVNYLERREGKSGGLTEDFLREQGFM